MGFFGFLGKVGKGALSVVKGVGITAGNVAGGVVGLDGLGSTINASLSKNNATAGVPTASVDGSQIIADRQAAATATSPSPRSGFGRLLDAVTGFFEGKNHVQFDANVGAGGRISDAAKGGLPSWLLPAGLAAGGLLLFTSMSGKRR